MRNVPKLRFKEFTDEWEEKKLGEISNFLDGKRKPLKDSDRNNKKGIYPYYGASGIIDYIDDYIFDKELILLGEDGANILTRSTRLAFLATGKYWVNNHAHVIEGKEGINQYFLCEYLEKLDYTQYNTGTAQPKLNQEVCKNILIKTPIFYEQQKISNFISNVDKKISITEEKLNLFNEYKKGIMQKIFNQELRFKDKNGNDYPEWEEKKFDEVFSFLQNNTLSRECLTTEEQEVQNIHYGDILTKYNNILKITNNIPYIKKEHNLSKFSEESFLKNGDIIIADTAEDFTVGKTIEIYNPKQNKVLSGLHTFSCRTNFEFAFGYLGQYMNSNQYHSQLYSLVTGIKVSSISKQSIKDTKIKFPCLEEQQKIADFLSAIDTKIEKISDELENLKEFKKGLLQQMFV